MEFFNAVSFSKAISIVEESLPDRLFVAERCSLAESCGRIIAKNIYAKCDFPTFRRSTVDGYALFSKDSAGASETIPALLSLSGSVKMGESAGFSLKRGCCAYVPTGGEVPDGANAVLMIEHSAVFADKIAVLRPVAANENIIDVADDVACGALLTKKGEEVTPMLLGKLAMAGESEVAVYPRVKAAVISTGDELVPVGSELKKGQIIDVNRPLISELLKKSNADIVRSSLVKDDYSLLKDEIKKCTEVADVIFLSGGSSVGQKDYTYSLLSELGKVHFHGVAMKPGKPTLYATTESNSIFGLPGNPIAAVLTYKSLFEEVILRKYDAKQKYNEVMATTTMNFPSSPGKTTVALLKITCVNGEYFASPVFYRSGVISKMTEANGYTIIADNTEGIGRGERIKAVLL